MDREAALRDLRSMVNIGKRMSEVLYSLGVRSAKQMMRENPERLYARLVKRDGKVDRCVLYTFRGSKLGKPWPKCMDRKR